MKKKLSYKLNILYLRLAFINQVFAKTLITFGFRCRIISAKLHVFGITRRKALQF